MPRPHYRRLLPAVFLATALLAVWAVRRPAGAARDLDDWDIPRLVDHLNASGLGLRAMATQKDATIGRTAYLTTTDREWEDINRLTKDPVRIDQWGGTLYCEQGHGRGDWPDLARRWGDCCLIAGPFLFFGDRDLLARIRAALTPVG
jgi:hypothetical protein